MIWVKLKAGSLQLTIFIMAVVALMLTAFIILVATYRRFDIQTDYVVETINNANKGIHYVLQNEVRLNDTVIVNLDTEDYKTLNVYRDFWGMFEKVIASSQIKTNRFQKIALIGAQQPEKDRISLYVQEQNKPLVIVGHTKIQGLAHVPQQGVRTGNISGHSYYGSQLIYGEMKTSGELPKLSNETLEHIRSIFDAPNEININQFLDINKLKSYQNSFSNLLQVVYSETDMLLSQVSLTGHIIVQSKTKIIVDSSSTLKDVLLIAPIIEIKAESKGAFQAFATKEISIGKNGNFEYPSAFVLMEDTQNNKLSENASEINETPFIRIDKGTSVEGIIIYFGDSKNYKPQMFIGENTTVSGEIYCNKNLELLGAVHGSVFTSGFVANQSGSLYQNHLYNATISVDDLTEEYVGLSFENSKKGVMKWLY